MMPPLPEMCNPSVLNSKEVGRRKALNIDQEWIFKSVFSSSFNMKSKTRTKVYPYWDSKVFMSMRPNRQQQQVHTEKWSTGTGLKWLPLNNNFALAGTLTAFPEMHWNSPQLSQHYHLTKRSDSNGEMAFLSIREVSLSLHTSPEMLLSWCPVH